MDVIFYTEKQFLSLIIEIATALDNKILYKDPSHGSLNNLALGLWPSRDHYWIHLSM